MTRWNRRFNLALLILLFQSLASAGFGQVTGVSLFNQANRNLASGSLDNPVAALSVTLAGPDTFNQLTVSNLGSAVTATDITNVRVWYQTASGQFSPAEAVPVGVLQPLSANSWQNSSPFNFPVTQGGRLFVTMDFLAGAVDGDTVQAQFPASGVSFTSGAYPSAALTNTGIQVIQSGGASNLVINNIANSAVSPGATDLPVLHMKVTASGPDPLLYVTVGNVGTAVDGTDIATVKLWDQPANSGVGFNLLNATYVGPLSMTAPNQWKNTNQFEWSIDNNNGLWVTVDLKNTATGGRTLQFDTPASGFQFGSTSLPSGAATNTGVLTIQPGSVQSVGMVPVPSDVFLPGGVNYLVYQASVSATGGDLLNTVQVNNTGSLLSGTDIVAVKLWYQQGGGPFSPGSAQLVGILDPQSGQSWKNNTPFSWSTANGDGLYVTVDLSSTATVGGTCVFQAPSGAFSFASAAFPAAAQTNPGTQTVTAPGQVTGLSLVNVPSADYWQSSARNLVLQVGVAANNADILQVMNVNNSAGNADEPTDLGNLTLWYQRGGGAFVPANAVNLGVFTRTGGRQWQFTGINKVLSGDGLYVTADIPANAVVGDTCDFGLAASGVSFEYGGNFPAASLVNSGAQTVSSPPTTSVALANVPAALYPPGSVNNPVLDVIVNGSTDTVTAFKAVQLGSAASTDVSSAKLWWQPGGGPFNTATAVQLDTLTLAGGTWKNSASFTPHLAFNGDALYVTADIASGAALGHTFQLSVPASGVTFQASGGVPSAALTNTGVQTIGTPFTATPTFSPTGTPTGTPSPTPSSTPTASATDSPTPSATDTATDSATPTVTLTPSSTPTDSPTDTPTDSPTDTATDSATPTVTLTPSCTTTDSPTSTPTGTPTDTVTGTPTITFTPSASSTDSPTSTPSATPTGTPTDSMTPTVTLTPSCTSTDSPTSTPTGTPTDTATPTASFTPTSTDSATPLPTSSPTDSPTSTATDTATDTPTPTATDSMTPTSTSTGTPTMTATASSTATDTATSTSTDTATRTPTSTPTFTSTDSPTVTATSTPSLTPTRTSTPTITPTFTPTGSVTPTPTPAMALYLDENVFNPWNQPLGMDLRVDEPGHVRVAVFNIAGQEVKKILDEDMAAGNYRLQWDGRNPLGSVVGNAVYFVAVQQPSGRMVRKVILLK